MRGNPFTQTDNDYIVDNAAFDTAEEMGAAIGRTGAAVSTQISKLRKQGRTIATNTQKGDRSKSGPRHKRLARHGYSFTHPDVPDWQRLTD
jgi:biotin operon repressor